MEHKNLNEAKKPALNKADVSKSFAVGKRVVIIGCEKGHMFKVGEEVTIVEKECDMWWAVNRHDEHWLINENEANVC